LQTQIPPSVMAPSEDGTHVRRAQASCDLCRRMKVRHSAMRTPLRLPALSPAPHSSRTIRIDSLNGPTDSMRETWRHMHELPGESNTVQCNARSQKAAIQKVRTLRE
jgi:hypothetical protein